MLYIKTIICYNDIEGSDKMNHKGFTLVELIAMLVVISVLMVIAIPNISGIIKKNRESIGVEDMNKLVRGARTKFSVKSASYPKNPNACVVLTMNYIDTNDDFKQGVNNGDYDRNESVVVVKKVAKADSVFTYKYYVRLVEKTDDGKTYVIGLVDFDTYSKKPSSSKYEELTDGTSFNGKSETEVKSVIQTIYNNTDLCSGGVTRIYS